MTRTDTKVWIVGGYQSDFSANYKRSGGDIATLVKEVIDGTFATSPVPAEEIQVIHVGNAFGELFALQGQMGAMPATVDPRFRSVPASRHEGACASGSLASLGAMADLEAGRYDVALVLGAEVEKTTDAATGAKYLGTAAWTGHEGGDAQFMWPHMFSRLADEYDERYGLSADHLHQIAKINITNAEKNPNAQTRAWDYSDESFTDDDDQNPIVEGWLRRTDCSNMTDGGAAIILVSDRYLTKHPELADLPRALISGWGHTTSALDIDSKLADSANDEYVLPNVRKAILEAFARSGVESVDDLSAIETHDCFSMSEYMAIDHFGITPPGQSWRAVENGDIAIDGRIPVNVSGGLIGGGHPVGATGIRMLLDSYKQVTNQAGNYQVFDANRVAALNVGGSTATTVAWVVSRGDEQGSVA